MTDHEQPKSSRSDTCTKFQRDGYLVQRSFIDQVTLNAIEVQLNQLIGDQLSSLPRADVFFENKDMPETLKQIQRLNEHVPFFHEMMNDGLFPELACALLQDDVVPKNLQYFNKPPGFSQPTPPHQDGYYFMIDPCEAVTMWLALDPVDRGNGCVRYLPGSHRRGMRNHQRTTTLGFSQEIADYGDHPQDANEQAIEAAPGDLLIHHAKTIHRADRNQSNGRSRRSLGLVYFAKRAKLDEVAAKAYQQKLAAELIAEGKL